MWVILGASVVCLCLLVSTGAAGLIALREAQDADLSRFKYHRLIMKLERHPAIKLEKNAEGDVVHIHVRHSVTLA